jgi:arginyl-tRNA--protein-N-Asp/Glu arginylyltransferase
MTTLMAELCQANFLSDCTSTDLDELISFYTTQQPTGTHKEKFDFFTHVRHENAGMQDQLFKAFATAILQSMPDYDEQAQLDFAWDEDVSEVLFKTFAHLII